MRTNVILALIALSVFGCGQKTNDTYRFLKAAPDPVSTEEAALDATPAVAANSPDASPATASEPAAPPVDPAAPALDSECSDAAACGSTSLAPFRSGGEMIEHLLASGMVRRPLPLPGAEAAVPAPALPDITPAPGGSTPMPIPMTVPSPTPAPCPGSGESSAFSATMVQDSGVDEPDRVKTDGRHLYMVKDRTLSIVRAPSPAGMREIARLELPAEARSMFLWTSAQRSWAVVLVQQTLYAYEGDAVPGPDGAPSSELLLHSARWGAVLVDVSNPYAPKIEACRFADGLLFSARRIDAVLAVIARRPRTPLPAGSRAEDLGAFFPRTSASLAAPGVPLFEAEGIWHGAPAEGDLLLTLATLDLDGRLEVRSALGLLGDPSVIYASRSSLYAAATVLASSGSATRIHRFEFGTGPIRYAGSGEVPGRLLDSYSLGEHLGHLRCATIDLIADGSRVTVLRASGGELSTVGFVDGIAPGEQLDAARFLGDRGYLSTSVVRRVDPLFLVDCSSPNRPRVLGSVDLPGFSGRLLPVSETVLLSLGRDGQGRIKVNLFDLSDPAAPVLADEEILIPSTGYFWGESEALSEPLALQWYPEEGLLALPVQIWGYSGDWWNYYHWEEAAVLRVRGTRIERVGALNTTTADTSESYSWWWPSYGSNPWTRLVFIGDSLYAVTRSAVRAAEIGDTVGEAWGLALR